MRKAIPLSTAIVGDTIEVTTVGTHVTTTVRGTVTHIGYAGKRRILHAADSTVIGSYEIGKREPDTYLIAAHAPEQPALFRVAS